MKRRQTFSGGYIFPKFAGTPELKLKETGLPHEIVIPLQQGFGAEVPPAVKAGDKVSAGQIVGIDDDSCSSPVHATVNGIVRDIRKIYRFGREISAVTVRSDGSSGWSRMDSSPVDLETDDPDRIGKILYLSGVASLGMSGFPTRYNTSPLRPEDADSLVINAVNSEPFALPNRILLAGTVGKLVRGVDILRRALPVGVEVHIGIDHGDKGIIKDIKTAADWLHVHPLKPKYPQSNDIVLVQTILGRKVPYGGSASDVKAVVMDVQSALHAYEAVVEGKPVMERIIVLGGSGLRENLFLKVRVGTPLENTVASRTKAADNRYIYGGIMTGAVCDNLYIPIDRTASSIAVLEENRNRQFLSFLRPGLDRDSFSNAFLSSLFPQTNRTVDTSENGERRPCIYCNYCEDVCPVGLMPYLLSKYVTHDMIEEADSLRILACIDCGLCTYVCPSKIPVMTHIQTGKRRIRKGNP